MREARKPRGDQIKIYQADWSNRSEGEIVSGHVQSHQAEYTGEANHAMDPDREGRPGDVISVAMKVVSMMTTSVLHLEQSAQSVV